MKFQGSQIISDHFVGSLLKRKKPHYLVCHQSQIETNRIEIHYLACTLRLHTYSIPSATPGTEWIIQFSAYRVILIIECVCVCVWSTWTSLASLCLQTETSRAMESTKATTCTQHLFPLWHVYHIHSFHTPPQPRPHIDSGTVAQRRASCTLSLWPSAGRDKLRE